MESPVYSLSELNRHIRETIEDGYPDAIWIMAEIASFNRNAFSGHCYLDLVDANGEAAKSKAMIWKKTFDLVAARFETKTGTPLRQGIKVQFLVKVEFNIQYGLSLIIWDVDPDFTLGEWAKKRAHSIKTLQEKGLLDKNKALQLNDPIQHLAIISSPTAAGFQDFVQHLKENPQGYAYQWNLFPSLMQGQEAIDSIGQALEQIKLELNHFQVLILIRGGGSQTDLQVFDELELAEKLADFPIPVFSGIGHQRDESVCDLVAHSSFKTPTAVADWLIESTTQWEWQALQMGQSISQKMAFLLHEWQMAMESKQQVILLKFNRIREKESLRFQKLMFRNQWLLQKQLHGEEDKIREVEMKISEINPIRILEKGYVRASQKGVWVKRKQNLNERETIEIQWIDGEITSTIN